MGKSKIEWTDVVWALTAGCNHVSKGCEHCWGEGMANRLQGAGIKGYDGVVEKGRWTGRINLLHHNLEIPLRWKKPRKVFVNSMSDLFHESVPFEFIDNVIDTTILCPEHIFQILTKRPERIIEYIESRKKYNNLVFDYRRFNIWLGVSVEDQKTADERIPILLQTPAAVRWLSVEPMLEEINITFIGCPKCGYSDNHWLPNYTICRNCKEEVKSPPENIIDWVIVGCESGHKRRECKIEWIESIVEQCKTAGVPVFVKQISIDGKVVKDINLFPPHLQVREFPN